MRVLQRFEDEAHQLNCARNHQQDQQRIGEFELTAGKQVQDLSPANPGREHDAEREKRSQSRDTDDHRAQPTMILLRDHPGHFGINGEDCRLDGPQNSFRKAAREAESASLGRAGNGANR